MSSSSLAAATAGNVEANTDSVIDKTYVTQQGWIIWSWAVSGTLGSGHAPSGPQHPCHTVYIARRLSTPSHSLVETHKASDLKRGHAKNDAIYAVIH